MMCFIGVWLSQAVPTYQYFVYMRLSGLFSLCYEYQSCNLKQVTNSSKDVSNVFRATFISLQREYQITLHLKLEALWKTTATKATSEARAKEEAEQCGFDGMYLCCSSSASYCGSWCDLVLTLSRLWVPLICRCLCYDRTRPSVSRKRSPPASSIWEESMKHELLDTHTQHIWKMHIYISLHTSIDFCVYTDAKKCHDASMLTDMSQVFKTSCTGCQKDLIFHLKHVL